MPNWYTRSGNVVTILAAQSLFIRSSGEFSGPGSPLVDGGVAFMDGTGLTGPALWEGVFLPRSTGGNCQSLTGGQLQQPSMAVRLLPGSRWVLRARFCDGSSAFEVFDVSCRADINGDGGVTVDDLEAFLSAFEAGSTAADISGGVSAEPDGGVDVLDLLAFLSAFEGGC